MSKSVQSPFSKSVPYEIFPLKERVRGKVLSPGEIEIQRQLYLAAIENLQNEAINIRDEFGVRRFDGGKGNVRLENWNNKNNHFPRLRWVWRREDINNGRTAVLLPLTEVLHEKKKNYEFLRQFFDCIADPLRNHLLLTETERIYHNCRVFAIRDALNWLDQISRVSESCRFMTDCNDPAD